MGAVYYSCTTPITFLFNISEESVVSNRPMDELFDNVALVLEQPLQAVHTMFYSAWKHVDEHGIEPPEHFRVSAENRAVIRLVNFFVESSILRSKHFDKTGYNAYRAETYVLENSNTGSVLVVVSHHIDFQDTEEDPLGNNPEVLRKVTCYAN